MSQTSHVPSRMARSGQWGSLWRRRHGDATQRAILSDWPVPRPRGWATLVDTLQSDAKLDALRRAVNRGQPYGGETWIRTTANTVGLESTLRARGRPRGRLIGPVPLIVP